MRPLILRCWYRGVARDISVTDVSHGRAVLSRLLRGGERVKVAVLLRYCHFNREYFLTEILK